MSSKKGQAVSEDNLEKASGGKVEMRWDTDDNAVKCRNPSFHPVYIVYDNRTNKLVKKFHSEKEAEEFDKEYHNKENNN